jgi:SAM-dependent methyltransferase
VSPQKAIAEQVAFYNDRWAGFEYPNRLKLERSAAILKGLADTRIKDPKIVDLGCGAGWLAGVLGVFGPTVGMDLSDHAVKHTSKLHPYVTYLQANVFDWKYPKRAFDVVVSQEVIEHVDDQARYVEICHDLLRPGGYLVLTTPNAKTFDAMTTEQVNAWGDQMIENRITSRELGGLLRRRFEVLRLTTIIPGFGCRGAYRVASSKRLKAWIDGLFGFGSYEQANCALGFGLHLYALARKK